MTQPYYGDVDEDGSSQYQSTSHGGSSNAHSPYERMGPYGLYNHSRYVTRPELPNYVDPAMMTQGPNLSAGPSEPTRTRTAVACARCRKRKIKCSGDPGDGKGCLACKTSGANPAECFFMRVGSQHMNFDGNSGILGPPRPLNFIPESAPTFEPMSPVYRLHDENQRVTGTIYPRLGLPSGQGPQSNVSVGDPYNEGTAYPMCSAPFPNENHLWNSELYNLYPDRSSTSQQHYQATGLPYTTGTDQQEHRRGSLPSLCADNSSPVIMSSPQFMLPNHVAQGRRLPAPQILHSVPFQSLGGADIANAKPPTPSSEPQWLNSAARRLPTSSSDDTKPAEARQRK